MSVESEQSLEIIEYLVSMGANPLINEKIVLEKALINNHKIIPY